MPTRREKPSGWTIAWILWLLAFVAIEVPAAIWSKSGTLSAHVWWRWFDEKWERWLIGITGVLVFIAHFVFEAPAWWSVIIGLTACAIVILLAEIRHRQRVRGNPGKSTRQEWLAHEQQHKKALQNEHPDWDEHRVGKVARKATKRLHGPEPQEVNMSKSLKSFLNRWGVLISVIYVALATLLKILADSGVEWASAVAIALAAVFGMLGINPLDPGIATTVAAGVTSAWALYGATRKVTSQVRKARNGTSQTIKRSG